MKIMRTICTVCVAALPAVALAELSFYAGVGVGGMRLEEDLNVSILVNDLAVGNEPISYSFPENGGPFEFQGTDLGARLFGGVRFGELLGIRLGLEGGYVDLGEPQDSLDFTIPFGPVGCNPAQSFSCSRPETSRSITYEDQFDGWEIYALAAFPLTEDFEIFGKFGVLVWESSFTFTNKAEVFPPQLPFIEEVTLTPASAVSTDGTDLAGGIGFNYKVSKHVSLRLEGTWYAVEDVDMLYMLGGGLIYDF